MQTVSASNVAVVGLSTAGECPVNSETPKSEAFDAMNSSKSASEKKKETDCWFFLNAECTKVATHVTQSRIESEWQHSHTHREMIKERDM
jgi:hypothetical protein